MTWQTGRIASRRVSAKSATDRPEVKAPPPASSRRRCSAANGMPPASMRAMSCSRRSPAALSSSSPPFRKSRKPTPSPHQSLQRGARVGAVGRLLAQLGGQRADPVGELQRLALDDDAAHLLAALAADAVPVDVEAVARRAEPHLDALDDLAAAEEPLAAPPHGRRLGQRLLELAGEDLDADEQV